LNALPIKASEEMKNSTLLSLAFLSIFFLPAYSEGTIFRFVV